MTDEWEFWNKSLQGEKQSIHEEEPKSGFYRYFHRKIGKWKAVAIWKKQDGSIFCTTNGYKNDPIEIWPYCCRFPVSHEDYLHAKNNDWLFKDEPNVDHSNESSTKDCKDQIKDYITIIDNTLENSTLSKSDIDLLSICAKNINRRSSDLKNIMNKECNEIRLGLHDIRRKYISTIEDSDEYCRKVVAKVEEYLISNNLQSAGRTGEKIHLKKVYRRKITDIRSLLDSIYEKYIQANDKEEITDALLYLTSTVFKKEDPKGIISIEYKKASM